LPPRAMSDITGDCAVAVRLSARSPVLSQAPPPEHWHFEKPSQELLPRFVEFIDGVVIVWPRRTSHVWLSYTQPDRAQHSLGHLSHQ
jgi:hypothetical protein